jgi:hypothetical protein
VVGEVIAVASVTVVAGVTAAVVAGVTAVAGVVAGAASSPRSDAQVLAVSVTAAAPISAQLDRRTAVTLAPRQNPTNAACARTDKLFSRTRHVR